MQNFFALYSRLVLKRVTMPSYLLEGSSICEIFLSRYKHSKYVFFSRFEDQDEINIDNFKSQTIIAKASWLSTLIVKAKCFSCIKFQYFNFLLHRRPSLHERLGKAWNADSVNSNTNILTRLPFALLFILKALQNWRSLNH